MLAPDSCEWSVFSLLLQAVRDNNKVNEVKIAISLRIDLPPIEKDNYLMPNFALIASVTLVESVSFANKIGV